MTSAPESQSRTRLFARIVGPFLAVIAGTAVARPSDMRSLLAVWDSNAAWAFAFGVFTLLIGLIVIALHPYWRGAAAILISALGWLATAKGIFLITFPQSYFSAAHAAIDTDSWWRSLAAVEVLLGVYLTYLGWLPARPRRASRTPRLARNNLPRAA